VPSAKDVNALIARIDELNKAVQKLSEKAPTAKAAPQAAAGKTTATRAKAKPTAKPATSAAKPAAKRAASARKGSATPQD